MSRSSGSYRSENGRSFGGERLVGEGEPWLLSRHVRLHGGLFSQVVLFHPRVFEEIGARALKDDATGFEDVSLVGNLERGVGVLLHQENGHAFRSDLLDNPKDLGDNQRP